jgi:hypothetical protein
MKFHPLIPVFEKHNITVDSEDALLASLTLAHGNDHDVHNFWFHFEHAIEKSARNIDLT